MIVLILALKMNIRNIFAGVEDIVIKQVGNKIIELKNKSSFRRASITSIENHQIRKTAD